jgi:hypothetical protein
MLSTTGLGGGGGAAGAGSGVAAFLAVIGAKADFVAATEGFGAGFRSVVLGAASTATSCGLFFVIFALFATLAATRGRTDDLAGAAFAALRAGATLCAAVFVVVFVGM